MKLGCLLSSDHRKTGLLDLLRVPHPSFAVNSTTPLDFRASGLSASGLVLTCCKEGFENNLEKLQKAGFLHMQTQGGTCLPSGTSPHTDADAGSFREFRMERSGILEAITLVSPVGVGRSMMQAHRSGWDKRVALPCGVPHAHCKTTTLSGVLL